MVARVEPLMAALWAALFLGESLTWPQIIGVHWYSRCDCVTEISASALVSTCGGLRTSWVRKGFAELYHKAKNDRQS